MSILAQVDLRLALEPAAYAEQLAHHQAALSQLARQAWAQRRPVVIVLEGWEAAGQRDAIARLTEKLDPHSYVVYYGGPPEGDDRARHYLYRFWRRLPERGHVAIFDGSWYDRVLAGRVEGLCTEAEWKRAYREIDQFERQLIEFGSIVVKFWLHISADEQLRRLQGTQALPVEDGRGRLKRALYEAAVEEMLLKTSTLSAPWTIVEADDASWAQVKVLRTVAEALFQELGPAPESRIVEPDGAGEREVTTPAQPGRDEGGKKGKTKGL